MLLALDIFAHSVYGFQTVGLWLRHNGKLLSLSVTGTAGAVRWNSINRTLFNAASVQWAC